MSYVRLDGLPKAPRWTPAQAVTYALGEVDSPDKDYFRMCDHFAGAWVWGYGGSGYVSAIAHWQAVPASFRHPGNGDPPAGALLFWEIGEYGHIAIAVAPGQAASTDIRRKGKVDVVPITEIHRRWGAAYLGWTAPYLARAWGRNPHEPRAVPRPVVHLASVVAAAGKDPGAAQGSTTHPAEVRIVERALAAEGLLAAQWVDGSFGSRTLDAYSAWQHRCRLTGSPAQHGSAADGIPGRTTLARLGRKHGFDVK